MAGILDLLNGPLGKTLIQGVSQQFSMDEGTTQKALGTAMPLILGAMKNNASTTDGATGLLGALNKENHNGGIMDSLTSILGGSNVDDNVMQDGAGILGHVFGGKENNVAQAVSKSSGIDLGSAMNILKVAAPVLMGALGKQAKSQNVTDQNGLGSLLGGMLGNGEQEQQSLVSKLLDADGDGSIIDDVAGMLMGGGKKGGLGSLLGNFLK